MKQLVLALLSAVVFAGCVGTHKEGISRYDDYDSVRVDQMVGNNVAPKVFEKTIVCLNARRETRRVTSITNVNVVTVTNATPSAQTNTTIAISTNYAFTVMTNLAPYLPPPTNAVPAEGAAEAALLGNVTNPPPAVTTNLTLSFAANQSASAGANQNAANHQAIRTYNNQISTSSNNLTFAVLTNQVVTAETNQVVSFSTNFSIITLTNMAVIPTNYYAHDYFLYGELIAPADFIPIQSGESLVLLVDGVRYGFSPSPSSTAFVARKGFASALYRASPEALVAIANAKEVKVRIKGVNNVIERTMSAGAIKNFKQFLVKYFQAEPEPVPPASVKVTVSFESGPPSATTAQAN